MNHQNLMELADHILVSACKANRHRESEIMQGVKGEETHARNVLQWVTKLTEHPTAALKIAALFHDIDRVVTPGVGGGFKGDRTGKDYQDHKKAHARRSADYICSRLLEHKADSLLVERIRFLILHHDDIGSEVDNLQDHELDILVAADSLAFFLRLRPHF